jgi:osmotically-inducible protein OsmY
MRKAKRSLVAISVAVVMNTFSLAALAQTGAGDDADTTARVQSALHEDNHLLSRHIDVSVKDGVVRLGGFVESDGDLHRALDDARAVPGVKSVDNHMTLKRAPSRGNGT